MDANSEIPLSKTTKHPEQVRKYMSDLKVPEKPARALVARDLSLERVRNDAKEYKKISLIDELTGLENRRALLGDKNVDPPIIGELQRMFSHSQRTGESLTGVMLDLDYFKQYNDTYGHQAGDNALRALAKLIRETIRESDFVARYGGEEFFILQPNTNQEQGLNLIERLRKVVENSTGFKRQITISGGLACFDPNETFTNIKSPEDLVSKADRRVYQAKHNGRNRIVFDDSNRGNEPKQ